MSAPPMFPIRSFAADDFAAICQLDAMCFPEGIAYPPEEVAYFLGQRGAICHVATDSGAVVAFILGILGRARRGGTGHVVTIDVHPAHRRRGLGAALMDMLEGEFRRRGCALARLEVGVNNLGAQAFYQARGYVRRRTIPNYYADGSDAYLLELKL